MPILTLSNSKAEDASKRKREKSDLRGADSISDAHSSKEP